MDYYLINLLAESEALERSTLAYFDENNFIVRSTIAIASRIFDQAKWALRNNHSSRSN
jgi:hypothetical protein